MEHDHTFKKGRKKVRYSEDRIPKNLFTGGMVCLELGQRKVKEECARFFKEGKRSGIGEERRRIQERIGEVKGTSNRGRG